MNKYEINTHDLNTFYFCAFRYALGRMTYIVSDVTKLLIKATKDGVLDAANRDLMTREIRRALDTDNAGMPCDQVEWKKLLKVLEND